jgi:hypothetical protein
MNHSIRSNIASIAAHVTPNKAAAQTVGTTLVFAIPAKEPQRAASASFSGRRIVDVIDTIPDDRTGFNVTFSSL